MSSEWTVGTLKEYADSHFKSIQRAVKLATQALRARLKLLNEFRQQSEDQAKKYVTKDEFSGLAKKVESIERTIYIATGGAIVIATLLSYVMRAIPTPLGR